MHEDTPAVSCRGGRVPSGSPGCPQPQSPQPLGRTRAGGLPPLCGWHGQRGSFIHHLPPQLSSRNSAMTWPWAERQQGTLPTGCWWHPPGSEQPGVGWPCIQGLPLRVIFRPCCAAFLSANLVCLQQGRAETALASPPQKSLQRYPKVLGACIRQGALGPFRLLPWGPDNTTVVAVTQWHHHLM